MDIRVPIDGKTRISVNRDGVVSAQKGRDSIHSWMDGPVIVSWLFVPFLLIEAIWWVIFEK